MLSKALDMILLNGSQPQGNMSKPRFIALTNNNHVGSSSIKSKISHHIFLHFEKTSNPFPITNSYQSRYSNRVYSSNCLNTSNTPESSVNPLSHSNSRVLLSISLVEVRGKNGQFHKIRTVFDIVSRSNFISSI